MEQKEKNIIKIKEKSLSGDKIIKETKKKILEIAKTTGNNIIKMAIK